MPLDAIYLSALTAELKDKLEGGRIDKVQQPERDMLLLSLRAKGENLRLLLAAGTGNARVHLTESSFENPAEPPMFCMLLRKHLLGARLTDITQPPMERCAEFTFDCTDEMGFPVQKKLVAELMGRTCNLYLLSGEGRILDCLRRVGLDESARPALPGLNYQEPEPVAKLPAESADFAAILEGVGADVLADRLGRMLSGQLSHSLEVNLTTCRRHIKQELLSKASILNV